MSETGRKKHGSESGSSPHPPRERKIKVVATNRKANFEYEIFTRYEAGISLVGTEVKSMRLGKIQMADAYVDIDGSDAFIVNLHISQYDMAHSENHDPTRKRRLLLNKREIAKLRNAMNEKGFTVIPLKVYFNGPYAKLEIATAKGKKKYDKREAIAKRDADREIARRLRGNK